MAPTIITFCDATIPIDEQNGIVCGSRARLLTEAGPRCLECFRDFGGVIVEGPEEITLEQIATDPKFLTAHLLEIAVPCHLRKGGQ